MLNTIKLLLISTVFALTFSNKAHSLDLLNFLKNIKTLENTPWSEIMADPNIVIQWPTMDMGGVAVPIHHICDKGDKFKTIRDINGRRPWISKSHLILVCTKEIIYPQGEQSLPPYCTGEWVPKSALISGTFDIQLSDKRAENTDQGFRLIGFKKYVIQCP